MLKIAIGHSSEPDTQAALNEVLMQCQESLQEVKPNAGLLFASMGYDFPYLLEEIKKKYPAIQLAGCSSFGEISSKKMLETNSVALMLFASDQIDFRTVLAKDISQNELSATYEATKQAVDSLKAKPALCFAFADGISSNISDVIEGLKNYFGNKTFGIAGGGACDDWEFKKVFLFSGDQVASNAASMLVFSEPMKSSMAVRHGRAPLPLNTKSIVTKSDKNIVYSIDHIPALEFYKKNLGEHANYEAYSLLIYLDDPEKYPDKYLVRAPFKINREDGSITFPGEVQQNSIVGISQLSTQGRTLDAAKECAQKACATFPGEKIEAALIFSCALRKEILGTETYRELEIIKNELPKDLPFFGYYTYGEIGQYNLGNPSMYFNETIVIVLLGE